MNSVSLIAQQPSDAKVRDALKASLRYDTNPGVRLKALDALTPYVKDDATVRDVVLEVLLHDNNPGVRSLALQTLQPVRADSAVRMELQYLADKDKDEAIKRQAQAMLATMPEIDIWYDRVHVEELLEHLAPYDADEFGNQIESKARRRTSRIRF